MKIHKMLQTHNSGSRNGETPKYIVIHYVGAISSARNNCLYFKNNKVPASAHFFCDSQIWQSTPISRSAWHCGGGYQDYGTKEVGGNKGAQWHGICRNQNSIGIELCCTKKNGEIVPSQQAIKTAVPLVKWLMKKYDIPASRVIRHFDVTGKCCLPYGTTEVLTPEGWKLMADLDGSEQIAQYNQNDGEISFTNYEFSVEKHFETVLNNRGLEATANHRMLSKPNGKNGTWKIRSWGEMLEGKKSYVIPCSGYFSGKGLDLTPEELRLLVWIQGDGHYMKGDPNITPFYGIEWHFSKKRKVETLRELLDDMEIDYSVCNQADETTKIRVYSKSIVEWAEEWLDNKCYNYNLLQMTHEQFEIFWNESLAVDGCKSENKEMYTSTIEKNIDVVQSLCAIQGMRTNKYYSNTCFFLSKAKSRFTTSGRERKGCPVEEREALVGCVEVPAGIILIRQKGKTFIVGNCPNGYISAAKWSSLHKTLTGKAVQKKKNPVYPTVTLQIGDKGEQVKRLQRCLNKIINAELDVDGSFGTATHKAVKRFQKKYGLSVDGSVGPKTRAKIKELIK